MINLNTFIINPLKNGKDCPDFVPLNDGTITGDPKYCNLSRDCKQIDMKSDYMFFRDSNNTESFDYFCTGKKVTDETKTADEELS